MTAPATWIRSLPDRYGRRALVALAAIAAVGLIARAYVVVNPVENPADDSRAYFALAKSVYEGDGYGGLVEDASDWSPGAPLLYSAAFLLTGGAREGTARGIEALLGIAAILVVFVLARRLAEAVGARGWGRGIAGVDPPSLVGLLAALGVAVYPPFIHSTGLLASEPPALLTLPAAVLAFLWAGDRDSPWAWLLPGALFGLTAMFRPEYLAVALALTLIAPLSGWQTSATKGVPKGDHARRGRLGRALACAGVMLVGIALPIAPWAVRNAIVLDRTVPISTGGGKALYTGTFLPADGEYQRVKAILVKRYLGRDLDPHSAELDAIDPTPLFDRVADRYPELPRDQALGRIGKQNFSKFFGEDPVGYAAMSARKVGRMWGSGVGEAMSSGVGRAVQILLVALGLAGLALLGIRRRWWELATLATPIVLVTLVGAATLAAPRRNEVLMTLVFPLAALALSWGVAAISSARKWSSEQASSPPS